MPTHRSRNQVRVSVARPVYGLFGREQWFNISVGLLNTVATVKGLPDAMTIARIYANSLMVNERRARSRANV